MASVTLATFDWLLQKVAMAMVIISGSLARAILLVNFCNL